mmetsp:Transcript_20858/g.28985  ORF Transcript_20858/g.28985 Transcript_20858/m.28985 type:complete len:403 (-) Transcript_20858:135-1343(-)
MLRGLVRRSVPNLLFNVSRRSNIRDNWMGGCNKTFQCVHNRRQLSTTSSKAVDLRSDTVTLPSPEMMQCSLNAPVGDDVYGEDPTVLALEEHMANLFGKEKGLYLPTCTMANLLATMAHCNSRASEVILGSTSHINLWEGGNAATVGGVHSREIKEDELDGTMPVDEIRDCWRDDSDDHCAKTELLCLENTQNMLGGIALPPSYIQDMGNLARDELNISLHVDGARIFNSAVAHNVSVGEMCAGADSVSICLSKGLGAPLGSVLVGESEFIRLAKRARKRCGGGMRQAGVVAAMGMYAVENNVERLKDDHDRAKGLAAELERAGFRLPRNGAVDTNMFYFALPENSLVSTEDFCKEVEQTYGIRLTGGYSKGGEYIRAVTHMHITDECIERSAEAIVKVCLG